MYACTRMLGYPIPVLLIPSHSAYLTVALPSRTCAQKPVAMPTYKEGKCAITYVHRFLNALTLNGEIHDAITIALLGDSLVHANNYNWSTTQRATYPTATYMA